MTKKAMTSIKKVDQHPPTAQFLWGLLCSLSSIDQERNNVSLFYIVEEIGIPQEIFKQEGKKVIPFIFFSSFSSGSTNATSISVVISLSSTALLTIRLKSMTISKTKGITFLPSCLKIS